MKHIWDFFFGSEKAVKRTFIIAGIAYVITHLDEVTYFFAVKVANALTLLFNNLSGPVVGIAMLFGVIVLVKNWLFKPAKKPPEKGK